MGSEMLHCGGDRRSKVQHSRTKLDLKETDKRICSSHSSWKGLASGQCDDAGYISHLIPTTS